MKLIEEFEYVKSTDPKTGQFIFTKESIKREVPRSVINFYNSDERLIEMACNKHKIYWQKLFGYEGFKNILTVKELEFIASTYGVETIFDEDGDIRATLKYIHPEFYQEC